MASLRLMKRKSSSASPEFSVREFFQRFPSEEACLDHIMNVRFGGTRFDCGRCGVVGATHHRLVNRRAYSCSHCGNHVYPTAGTILHDTRTPLVSWFYAMYLFCATRHGVSGKELQRQLGVTYKTAYRIGQQIRDLTGKADFAVCFVATSKPTKPSSAVGARIAKATSAVAAPPARPSSVA